MENYCVLSEYHKLGLSKGPDPPENPTRPDRFWGGSDNIRIGFGPKFRTIFRVRVGVWSISGPINILLLNLIFFFWKKTLLFVALSSAE